MKYRTTAATSFDFGELESEMATRNPDGTISFVTITPGISTLTLRDPQHEYVFVEK